MTPAGTTVHATTSYGTTHADSKEQTKSSPVQRYIAVLAIPLSKATHVRGSTTRDGGRHRCLPLTASARTPILPELGRH